VKTAAGDTHKVILVQLGRQVKSSLTPLVEPFGALSSSKVSPVDLLDAKLISCRLR
jgi:hypothetical protein